MLGRVWSSEHRGDVHDEKQQKLGIGLDCSVISLKNKKQYLIQTTDFFYPLIEDPYVMGKIACANVLSDLYAMGVVNCDNMLMTLGVSSNLSVHERDVIVPTMMRGFNDLANEAETHVTGGQTIKNPWMIIGGIASSVVSPNEFIMPTDARSGDKIILTKPLGTQLIVNAFQWMDQKHENWKKIKEFLTEDDVYESYEKASSQMSRLNRTAARLMHKYEAHACTDVTGFGILGHAQNLVKFQKNKVDFHINTLPILKHCADIELNGPRDFGLLRGTSAETSGGLMICLPAEKAELFCTELFEIDGCPSWVIGDVVISQSNDYGRVVLPETIHITHV